MTQSNFSPPFKSALGEKCISRITGLNGNIMKDGSSFKSFQNCHESFFSFLNAIINHLFQIALQPDFKSQQNLSISAKHGVQMHANIKQKL